jgi:melibiase-like protein
MTKSSFRTTRPAHQITARFAHQIRYLRKISLLFGWALALCFASQAQELSNDKLRLKLNVTPEGIPVIEEAVWQSTGRTIFRDLGTPDGLGGWVQEISANQATPPVWELNETEDFITAEATFSSDKLSITWVVELQKQGQLFRLHVRLTNHGKKARAIDSFPVWQANWDAGGQSQWVRSWRAIEYDRVEQSLDAVNRVRLASRLNSSEDVDGGVNPYWIVGGPDSWIFFGLQWSGGWNAKLQGLDNGFKFSVFLPPEECQLTLKRGDSIDGPTLFVTPTATSDEVNERATWMRERHALGRLLYSTPPLSFLLTYNNWYATRIQVDDNFVNRQFSTMTPYSFDAFVIDAGWFGDGRWKPDPAKFKPGEFVDMLSSLKSRGIKPGLWSTPQYVSTINNDQNDESELAIQEPPVHSNFIGGDLVDVAQDNFPAYVVDHVQLLRNRYSVDYWKYDQPFFSDQSKTGKMKDVIGFQTAIQKVRAANPDLFIENCLNGGRMINEFTLLATQATWLADLGSSGIPDPHGNVSVALNAMDFIFPWASLRFTINFDRIDPNDDEMTRFYCRSAMVGMWGISSDLGKIPDHQRDVILKEIENYRRLNQLKFSCLYDLQLPSSSAEVAGVTFYSRRRYHSGVILYRWSREGAFDQHVTFAKLKSMGTYRVTDVDTGVVTTASGSDLNTNGIDIPFTGDRLSALVFVEPLNN